MDIVENILDSLINMLKEKKSAHRKKRKQIAKVKEKKKEAKKKLKKKAINKNVKKKLRKSRKIVVNNKRVKPIKKKPVVNKKEIKLAKKKSVVNNKKIKISKEKTVVNNKRNRSLDKPIGEITHFFSKIKVVVVKVVDKKISVGDKIRIKGKNYNFIQTINSMQVESVDVKSAGKGKLIGIKVRKIAKVGDLIYRI